MAETAALVRNVIETEGAAGKYLALFCIALLIIWLFYKERKGEAENVLLAYGIVSLVVLIFSPILYWLLQILKIGVEYQTYLWLLPVLTVTAYAAVLLSTRIEQQVGCKTEKKKWLCVAACIFVTAMSGTVLPYTSAATKLKYTDQNAEAAIEAVIAQKESVEGPVVLAAQQEIVERIRSYDGEILLLYGKDMWMEDANTAVADVYPQDYIYLYERMKVDYQDPEEVAGLAERFGCNVLVLREKIPEDTMQYERWKLAAQVPGYLVYRISK